MTGSVFDADGEAGELTFKTGSAWTFTATRGGSALASNDYGTEMYQGCGNFTQTVENLESGLYKVSIQALYRDGANAAMAAAYNEGYALGVAYMQANDSKVLVKAWAEDRSDDNTPNNVAEFAESVSEGNYVSETYAYVGSDGTLSLTVNVPSFAGFGWFQGDNVTYQKMKEHVNIPFGIKILGKEIDSSNCGDFTVEGLTGTVTYDPDSKTLTLTDVTILNEGETNCIRNEEVDGLTINVVSDSKLTSKSNGWGVIYTKKDITITGDGKLTVETVYPNYCVSISGGSLTLKDINMSVSGDLKGYASESDQYLYIDLADDKCIEIGGSVYGFTDIVYLNGSKSLKPEGAWYDTANKYLTAGSGKAVGITFADKDATGIEGVKADGAAAGSKGTYTVDGRRLNGVPARKGMYISGGRKIAVR